VACMTNSSDSDGLVSHRTDLVICVTLQLTDFTKESVRIPSYFPNCSSKNWLLL
jgi:hypothetical protein